MHPELLVRKRIWLMTLVLTGLFLLAAARIAVLTTSEAASLTEPGAFVSGRKLALLRRGVARLPTARGERSPSPRRRTSSPLTRGWSATRRGSSTASSRC